MLVAYRTARADVRERSGRKQFRTHTFRRKGPLTLEAFANSGADWLDRFKPYIEDGKTIVCGPHKVFGP